MGRNSLPNLHPHCERWGWSNQPRNDTRLGELKRRRHKREVYCRGQHISSQAADDVAAEIGIAEPTDISSTHPSKYAEPAT
jgi:hypothetical protein